MARGVEFSRPHVASSQRPVPYFFRHLSSFIGRTTLFLNTTVLRDVQWLIDTKRLNDGHSQRAITCLLAAVSVGLSSAM